MNLPLPKDELREFLATEEKRIASGELTTTEKLLKEQIEKTINVILGQNSGRMELLSQHLRSSVATRSDCTYPQYFEIPYDVYEEKKLGFLHEATTEILRRAGYTKLQELRGYTVALGNMHYIVLDKPPLDTTENSWAAIRTSTFYEKRWWFFKKATSIRIYFSVYIGDLWEK